jgi:hypothetical protein
MNIHHNWSDKEKLAARAIYLIEKKFQPQCPECGYGADRQKCAMDYGGGCPRHTDPAYLAYIEVIEKISEACWGKPYINHPRWRQEMPVDFYMDFNDHQKALILDLFDKGGSVTTKRKMALDVYDDIRDVTQLSYQNVYTISLGQRGIEYAERLSKETK